MKPHFIILTGKTASGKDTIQTKLLSRYPNLKRIITTTSRIPREGEQNGHDYYFITKAQFEKKIDNGDFAEYVDYGGNFYGTYKSELETALKQNTIWRIDPSRAGEVRDFIKRTFSADMAEQIMKRILVIYITVPDEVALQRLRERDLSEEEIDKRLADDASIWREFKDKYDFVVENVSGKLDQTIKRIVNLIDKHKFP